MQSGSKQDFMTMELNPDLLSTLYKEQTYWCVVTGASCSGKTTLIDQLADKKIQTCPEPARQYFERELTKGRTIDEIREDRVTFTSQVYSMMVERERGLPTEKVIFLDRGLPDALAFYRFAGLDPNEILPDCFQRRYAIVFMLERLPYQWDGVRAGDDETAHYFESWTSSDYSTLGYDLQWVPVLPPDDRLTFVLDRLYRQGFT